MQRARGTTVPGRLVAAERTPQLRRLLLACLALLLPSCVALGVTLASADARSSGSSPQKPPGSAVGRELTELRTATSKTFAGRNGQRTVRVSSGRVHFRNARGKWQNVDTNLRRAHGRLLNRTTGFSTSLPLDLAKDSVRVRRGKWSVGFTLRGAKGVAVPRGAQAVYRNAFPGVDVDYRLLSESLKETMTLASRSSRRSFSFDLQVGKGLRPKLTKSKGVQLVDRRGVRRLALAAPFMKDAKGRLAPVAARLVKVNGTWRLTLTASSKWLDRKDRAWPVKLDPAVYPTGDTDCFVDSAYPDASYCASEDIQVGSIFGGTRQMLVRFDGLQAAVPKGADVAGASLVLNQLFSDNTDWVKVNGRALTESWTSAATWDLRDGTSRWSQPGGNTDEHDTAGSQAGMVEWPADVGNGTTGERAWHMFGIVRDWVSGKRANHGVLLKAESTTNRVIFAASEYSDASKRPYLNISYTPRTGERRGYVHERQQLSDRISMGVNIASGNLNVAQTDFSMPGGLGPDVQVSRAYNSLDPETGAFGRRWRLNTGYDFSVGQAAGGRYVTVRYPGGADVPYTRKANGDYDTPPGYDNKLTRDDATGRYTLTDNASQTKYRFGDYSVDGRIEEQEDRNGRKLTFKYTSAGEFERIESAHTVQASAGDETRFVTSADRITMLVDPSGRTSNYGYTSGTLTSYTDAQNGTSYKTLYEYAGVNGQLSKITTPQGKITTIECYPVGHEAAGKVKAFTRVTNNANLTGARWEFEYLIRRDGSGETRVTDPIGVTTPDTGDRVTTYTFDTDGRVTKTKDALGRETQRKITSTSKVNSYTAAGNTGTTPNTSFTYDTEPTPENPKGTDTLRKTETPTGSGSPLTTTASYGASGQINGGTAGAAWLPTESTNEQGKVTQTNYKVGTQTNGNVSGIVRYDSGSNGNQTSSVAFEYETGAAGAPGVVDGKPGQLKVVKDGRSNPTSYEYDGKGNVKKVSPPAPLGATNIVYHPTLGRVAEVQDGNGNWRVLSYDNLDRLTRIEYRGADKVLQSTEPYVAYTYDRDGNQLTEESREQGTGTIRTRTMTYDAQNRVTYESLPGGLSNTYTYDLVGNLLTFNDGVGKIEYTYDATNQQRAIFDAGSPGPIRFEHNVDGLRTKTRYPNGVTVSWSYDNAFRVTGITATNSVGTLQQLAYAYTGNLRTEKSDIKQNHRTKYDFDSLERLTTATIKPYVGTETPESWAATAPLATYSYGDPSLDGAGNVVKRTVSGPAVTASTTYYAYNAANQLCWRSPTSGVAAPSNACTPAANGGTQQTAYDANGNELTGPAGSGRTATYNLLDQTTQLAISGTPTSILYLGAGQDRWIQEGTSTIQHSVLGFAGRGTTRYTRDENGTPLARRNGTARGYYLTDALGSVMGLTAPDGSLADRQEYTPYGEPAPNAPGQWGAGTGDIPNGYLGFAGGYKSVGGLYHFGQRYYDPSAMRWTQPDPLDQTGDLREGNKYLYAGADPVNSTDPTGQWSLSVNFDAHLGLGGKVGFTVGSDGVGVQGQVGAGIGLGADAKVSKDGVGGSELGGQAGYCAGACSTTNYPSRKGYLDRKTERSYGPELGASVGFYGKSTIRW